ncbi:MAG: SET domain-containing protein [Cytophagaceae bacterium]|jgi:SET domain-containing protein|nr:SET domain-containing protein [Cytophagaceae bacterium]
MTKINHTIVVRKRCTYVDSKGNRCTKETTVTHPYCPQHTQKVLGLKVAKSTVPFAGLGLFTLKPIKKGDIALFYEGEKLTVKEYNKRYEKEGFGEYGMTLGARHVIDARKTSSGLGRYVCDYTGSGQKANVKYYDNKGKIEITAKRNIEAGEELMVSYGKEMRTAMGFQHINVEEKKRLKKEKKALKKSKKEKKLKK